MSVPGTYHCHLKQSLDWTGWACGLASQVTGPHTIVLLPMGIHKKLDTLIASWFWREPYCPYSWSLSQQQTSGRNLEFLSTHINLCCIIVSFGLRSVTLHLTICSTLVQNRTFAEYLSAFLNSRLSHTQFDGQWHCKDTHLTYSCLTINLCFVLSYHLIKFGHGVFCTRYIWGRDKSVLKLSHSENSKEFY
jgi:hypothetical protein